MSSRTLVESRVGRFTSPPPPAATDTYSHARALKITGVRIDTDNVALWRQSLKPTTRATVLPDDDSRPPRPSALNSIENKNITNLSKPIINAPTPMQSRRKQRYTRAEEALAKSLKQRKPSPTAQELQIRALEQVTALLRLHAQEAHERATKLREVLAQSRNGGVGAGAGAGGSGKGGKETPLDPEVIKAMQRERWMEEKRKGVVDCEAEAVREQIVSLTRFGAKSRVVSPSKGAAAAATAAGVGTGVMDEETRRRANNLAKFFELSPTRKPISSRKKSLSPLSSYDRAPRRVTMNDASPMLLRTSIASSFTPYTAQGHHARSISLDGGKVGNRSSTASSTRYLGNASLAAVAEDTTGDNNLPVSPIPSTPTPTPPTPPPLPTPATTTTSLPTSPSPPSPPTPKPHRTPSLSTTPAGTVTIYTPILRSKADILASMGKQVEDGVEVPRYALELIGDLDYIPEGISVLCAGGGGVGAKGEREREGIEAASRNRYFKAGLPNPRSLIRKSSPTTPTPTTTTKKQRPRPQSHSHPHNSPLLSNLFSISETPQTTTTTIPLPIPIIATSHDSTMSSPIPPFIRGDDGARNHGAGTTTAAAPAGNLRTSTSTTSSSSFEVVHSFPHVPIAQNGSPTKPRQRFSFLGRK